MKNGATAVCQGRSMIRREIPTLANYFSDAGYKTILSGNGKELYNIAEDPHQDRNVAAEHPERFESMAQAYRQWHRDVHPEFLKTRYIDLGHPRALSTILYASDWDGSYCDNPHGLEN